MMSEVACSLIANMREVSRDEFFQYVGGPWDIHPNPCRNWSEWKINGSGRIVGVTLPGYIDPSDTKRYFIEKGPKK